MRRGAILVLILSLVLVACRASTADTTVIDNPPDAGPPTQQDEDLAGLESEAQRLLAEEERIRTLMAELVEFPLTVDDDRGAVTLQARPERIVSLSATHTEILYALGAQSQVAGTDLTSNYPAAANQTEKVDSFNFSIEELAALEPDLVVLAFDFQGEGEALDALEIPFLLLGPATGLESALGQILTVGVATGHFEAAAEITSEMVADVEEIVRSAVPQRGVTVFHEVDNTLYSATSDTFVGDLYRRLGFVNIADAADGGGPFPQLSSEFIVDQSPEFIFLADANFGVTVADVAGRPGWEAIPAVRSGNIVPLDGDIAGRWGPRTVELMRSILDAVVASVP
ncbi:MAG: ABC transporter substrate-binding protein [Acidimicrobiia bacterium]